MPCEINDVKSDIACLAGCFGINELLAIKLYALVQQANETDAAFAGDTLEDWKVRLAPWQVLSPSEQVAQNALLSIQAANTDGASVPTDPNQLRSVAKCYFCEPKDEVLTLIAGLQCYVGSAL